MQDHNHYGDASDSRWRGSLFLAFLFLFSFLIFLLFSSVIILLFSSFLFFIFYASSYKAPLRGQVRWVVVLGIVVIMVPSTLALLGNTGTRVSTAAAG